MSPAIYFLEVTLAVSCKRLGKRKYSRELWDHPGVSGFMPKPLVRKRCFVQMRGYYPVGADNSHRRFIREIARFQKAWPRVARGGDDDQCLRR